MTKCAHCGNVLDPGTAWKGRGASFYCNEFCAESEDMQISAAAEGEASGFGKQPVLRVKARKRGEIDPSLVPELLSAAARRQSTV